MTKDQITAIRCAYADLLGALQSRNNRESHDWDAHRQTLRDLVAAFPDIHLEGRSTHGPKTLSRRSHKAS